MPADNPASSPSALGAQDEKARAKARLGQTIKNKYRLDSLLGVGGMASVFAATHRNGSRVALKILHAEFARDNGIRDRFLKEGYVANKVDHSGRVAILDDDITEQEEPYLVMELLEGETLQQLWKRLGRKAPVPEALYIAEQTLDTLQAFHDAGIVHRDIKPANIFVTHAREVKVLDFGVARVRDPGGDRTRAGTALGTPSFMAPEQAMGLTEGIDGRADVFSVGATLYAVLSGQRLHQGRSDNEAFILAATQPAPSLARIAPDLPVEVIALVDRALAWDVRNRFATAREMREEILRLLSIYQPTAAPPANRAPQPVVPQATQLGMPRIEPGPEAPPPAIAQPSMAPRPVASQPAPVAPAPEGPTVSENDPAVLRLVDFFRRIERLLPTVRQYGWGHPESENKLRVAFQGLLDAVKEDAASVTWTLQPYSFLHKGVTVWEPTAPHDVVPYNLFAAGVRAFRVKPGVNDQQLKALCEVFLIDPHKDLSPEDDVGSALWERRLTHIQYDVINLFAEGDAAAREAFYEEADQMEALASSAAQERANRAEAMAMNIQTDTQALQAKRLAGQALALDAVARKTLGAQLETSPERWSERFVDVLVDAFLDAMKRRDAILVLEPLDASIRDLVLSRRFDLVFRMWGAIVTAIENRTRADHARVYKTELTRGMMGPETFRLLLVEATRVTQNVLTPLGYQEQLVTVDWNTFTPDLTPIVTELGPDHVGPALTVIDALTDEGFRKMLLGFVQRNAAGREGDFEQRIPLVSIDTMRTLLAMLSSVGTPQSHEALRRLCQSTNATVRCEATAFAAGSPDAIAAALQNLGESPQPEIRSAALRTMAFHQVRSASSLLAKRIQDPQFNQVGLDERREIFGALYAIFPQRAEQIAIEIVQKHGLLVDESLEQTRALCAELLGKHSGAMTALEAVLAASKRRWWNTQPLREAATAAAEAIAARLGRRISASGELM